MTPFVPRISGENDYGSRGEVEGVFLHIVRLERVAWRNMGKVHDASTTETYTDDSIPKAFQQVDVWGDSFAWMIEVDDCLVIME